MTDPIKRPFQLPPNLPPEDPTMQIAALKGVVQELTGKIQFLVEWLDDRALLEDHAFTFPDGDIWKAQDSDVEEKKSEEGPPFGVRWWKGE